jgi:hypothetical protein
MSRQLAVIGSSKSPLYAFASALVAKATNNAVAVASTASAAAGAVAIGEAPKNAHTVVVAAAPTAGPYAGAKVTFVRALLPDAEGIAARDALDVFASSGISSEAEVAAAKKAFAESAKIAVAAAKGQGNKVTVLVKQASKLEVVNTTFQESITEAAEQAGVSVEFVDSATVTNQLIMFPEQVGVVATADTAAADVVETAVSGLFNAAKTYVTPAGNVAGGAGVNSVATAVAEALKAQGFVNEARKITDAVAKAATNDNGKSVLAAL